MSISRQVVVVGAGIIGASIAWHLARRGASVTIVAETTGGVATPNSFAWINASWGNPKFYYDIRHRSMQAWKQLAESLPDLPLQWCGSLGWDLPQAELESYATEHGGWGYGIRRVGREGSARIEPNLAQHPDFALHVAEEGAVEPVAAARLLVADAVRHGAMLRENTRVQSLATEGSRIAGVRTTDDTLRADTVVLATGAASELASSVGIELPLVAPPGLIVHSRPYRRILSGIVLSPQLHMRQTAEGRIIAGSDFGGSDPGDAPQAEAEALFSRVKAMLRNADDLLLDFHTIGYRPNPQDGFPIIGKADGKEGVYLAVMHSGVTLAPIVGQLAADEILADSDDTALSAFRLSRFAAT